jgi:hypothetical protein
MEKLSKVMMNPSAWDSRENYMGSIPEDPWLVVMGWNRDSDILSESNCAAAIELLGGESETVQIFRFGHWACGWIEYLCVKAGSPSEAIGDEICERLEAYPILDENDFSEREQEEADRVWQECYDWQDRIERMRKFRDQFTFHSWRDMLACARGRYYAGYASELVH